MKHILKKSISLILIAVMCLSGVIFLSPQQADALSKGNKTPKLSASSVFLAKGGSRTITLKNGKGNWSVAGSGIVKIKKKTKKAITVTPVKPGTATIICRCGKRKLKCKVKVLNERIGDPEKDLRYGAVVGQSWSFDITLPEGITLAKPTYDPDIGKVTVSSGKTDSDTGETVSTIKIKALKPGRFTLGINCTDGKEVREALVVNYAFINGFRGKTKVKKTEANYRKWRTKTINSLVTSDMSSWEIIDAIGMLISTGKYGLKGGANGMQLWYGGNGTCVSGAKMMDDFMKDLGIRCKVHDARYDAPGTDIFGYSIMYGAQHKNVRVTLGGKKYELNPQPGLAWPYGTIRR